MLVEDSPVHRSLFVAGLIVILIPWMGLALAEIAVPAKVLRWRRRILERRVDHPASGSVARIFDSFTGEASGSAESHPSSVLRRVRMIGLLNLLLSSVVAAAILSIRS